MPSRHCRACGKFIFCKNPRNLFNEPDCIQLHQIEALTGLYLLECSEFNFPVCICGPCEVSLREAVRFRERIILTQKALQNSRRVLVDGPNGNEVEGGGELELDVCKQPQEDTVEEQQEEVDQQEVLILEEITQYEVIEEQIFDAVEKLPPEEAEREVIPEEVNRKEQERSKEVEKSEPPRAPRHPYPSVTFADNSDARHQPRVQWDKLSEEEVVALKRERRKRDCICEQCGRHFSCPSNFKVHLLRHTGLKSFACTECPQKFYTAHLLRRHQDMHSGERPYPCQFCEMTFANTSVRTRHERVRHTNIKPFKCTECDKSFAMSGKLREHMLTHTGERAFHCEPCKASFVRRSHLLAHLRTKGHAQNTNVQEVPSKAMDIDVE
ncbi:hypothetical protein KR038_006443, partial [Drosophila bunnanda]